MSLRQTIDGETRVCLSPGYQQHAAWQSMASYLADWRIAHRLLEKRIAKLQRMCDDRKAAAEAGTWPPASPTHDAPEEK